VAEESIGLEPESRGAEPELELEEHAARARRAQALETGSRCEAKSEVLIFAGRVAQGRGG
jgi:hypothetical protein